KKKQAQMKEIIRVQKDRKNDDIASARISSIATDLIINKGMDWVKAHEEAVRIYKEETESTTEK
ncbi:MAG TPA: hypothetical protein P5513_04180, partial [Candidatus Diapherotrites archaeon]|nr:hypothetical protein [Candidatus Diapherotrites archaeon]